jgi:hypothetical protein
MHSVIIKNVCKAVMWLFLFTVAAFFAFSISSCGKSSTASPQGLNIEYEVLNFSPDLGQVDLFVNFQLVNQNPFVFNVDQGYFYVPSVDTPYQIRSAVSTGTTLFPLDNILQPGAKYTLYIIGAVATNSDTTLLTVDTATEPPLGRGKLRFVNVSPSATGGLDIYANGTLAFSKVLYKQNTGFTQQLPVGNYDLQINATGTSNVLFNLPSVTIQDGKLYTLYAYGYTSRTDSAAFTAAVTTNH